MKQKNALLVSCNTITFVLMLLMNYTSNARLLNGLTVADIAHKYDTLFAPADYAFIIWGVIYLLCTGFIIYQFTLVKNDPDAYIQRTGFWFAVSNLANTLWVYCWVHEWLDLCVIIIFILLVSLIILTIKLRLELDDEPVRVIFFVWWPIAIYLGWVMVATIASAASWLVSIQWKGFGFEPDIWTIIMIVIACILYIFLNQTRNLRESVIAGIWAFIAIAVQQVGAHDYVAITAIIASLILTVLTAVHFYNNRYYIPFVKIKRGEWR
jgi:hypothetical protein